MIKLRFMQHHKQNPRLYRSGFTLIEMVVSLGLFAILGVLVIVSYVSYANIQAKAVAMKNSQQKLRVAIDQIEKQVKEAKTVTISDDHKTLSLTFDQPGTYAAARYVISKIDDTYASLSYSECNLSSYLAGVYVPCDGTVGSDINSAPSEDMLAITGNGTSQASVKLVDANSSFSWNSPQNVAGSNYNLDASISIALDATINYAANSFYQDNFKLDTIVSVKAPVIN